MKTIKIIIERSKDMFTAYSENVAGIYGGGDTVEEAKQSILESIEIVKGFKNAPKKLKGDYELVYKFDTQSLLKYYKGTFTNAAMERLTGINQGQLSHYLNGIKKPRATQVKKIETALHKLGQELIAVEL